MRKESLIKRRQRALASKLVAQICALSLLALATTQASESDAPLIESPVLKPSAGTPLGSPLPVELLGPLNQLDLSAPAKVQLPVFDRSPKSPVEPESEPEETDVPSISMMPALVAPKVEEPRVAIKPELGQEPSDEATEPTDESEPEEFSPEWRSPGVATEEPGDDQTAPLPEFAEEKPAPAEEATDSPSADETPTESPETDSTATDPSEEAEEDKNQSDPPPTVSEPEPIEDVIEQPAKPAVVLKPLTRNQIYLRNRLRTVLSHYFRKPLNSRDHDSWEMMHSMLAYELHSRMRVGGPRGQTMTTIGWLCYNNKCKGNQLLKLTDEGLPHGVYGVGKEGHSGQFLAMLAQCNVDPEYPIRVGGQEFTINDLIRAEQRSCHANSELSFKLIALMHYLPSDTTWVNDRGEAWSIERLVREELNQPIRGVACGGSHRLSGLSRAVRKRELRGEPVEDVWLEAKKFTDKYEQYCYRLQNSDGSFSTEWFRGPGKERDIDRRCRTTGHLTEWILYHVEDEQLTSYRVVKAVNYLTNLLYTNADHEWEVGAVYHALHALTVYNNRLFKPYDEQAQAAKAAKPNAGNSTTRKSTSSRRR